MAEDHDAVDRALAAQARREAYRTANRLISSAGISLALSGVRPGAPEMEAIRRALRAVNAAGGIPNDRKEVARAFHPSSRRFDRNAS
jgi:hypothetical protein